MLCRIASNPTQGRAEQQARAIVLVLTGYRKKEQTEKGAGLKA